MTALNFTLIDLLGVWVGVLLFSLTALLPGYAAGWAFHLFDFRRRLFGSRLVIGVVLSLAFSPIFIYLTALIFSLKTAAVGLALLLIIPIFKEKNIKRFNKRWRFFAWVGAAWAVFAAFALVNLQWGNSLWLSIVSFDQTGRVSIVDAITRSGVPPINPSYYPGEAVPLMFLYYFWYILCSLIDMLGGSVVDARAALNASSIWAGFGLIAIVLLYLRLRNGDAWQTAWRGVALLSVSGLDVLPALMLMLATRQIIGSVDVWNTWIVSWVGSALWVPHHLAALVAALTAILLIQYARHKDIPHRRLYPLFAGAALASAFGLSVWVTFVFGVFWLLWFITLVVRREQGSAWAVFLSAAAALFFSSPFLVGLIQSASSAGEFPIIFEVRSFLQLESFVKDLPVVWRSLVMLAALPFNYILELGFFSLAGLLWFTLHDRTSFLSNPFYLAELLLLAVTLMIASLLRSTLGSNDLGWRAWLAGQFVLLIWGVDVWIALQIPLRTKRILLIFALFGILSTAMDAALLRSAWVFMTDGEESRRYYSARLAYEFIRDHTPDSAIVQNNPFHFVDRPSGLYGTRQMVISSRTPYGMVTEAEFERLSNSVGALFLAQTADWQEADQICAKHAINIFILSSADPAWQNLSALKIQRAPRYENAYYAIFDCGEN